jgi:hypothetical protein
VLPVHFAACTERSLEQIKSGLWPTHLFRQITGAITAYSYDGTKSSANLMIQRFLGEFNGVRFAKAQAAVADKVDVALGRGG